jgi:HAD superfamily hydrolase (TIGR01490 family)
MKDKIAIFDFDGTITTKDTFIEFIRFAKGRFALVAGFTLFLPLLIAYKLKCYPNWKVKEQIFSFFFKGMKLSEFDKVCEEFAAQAAPSFPQKQKYPAARVRPAMTRGHALQSIETHRQNGDEIVIVSASIENWVRPFAEKLGISETLCTKIETDEKGCLTGKFSTKNCYGQEKVNRLLAAFPNLSDYYLTAYGDSKGDRELLDFADEKHYKYQ